MINRAEFYTRALCLQSNMHIVNIVNRTNNLSTASQFSKLSYQRN